MAILLLSIMDLFGLPSGSSAAEYKREGNIIGEPTPYQIRDDDSLYEIARSNDIGMDAIMDANPHVDPFIPRARAQITIPTQWILPDVPVKRGIVINIAEMRLYYYGKDGAKEVITFPIGIGDQGADTPVGTFAIIEKIRNPSWYVPRSIRQEKPDLPAVVPPGPDNPMGSHALRLSNRTLLIHGTDRPWGIGTRNSHGCIRLYQEDIAQLFGRVRLHSRVTIVNQPVKAAAFGGRVFIEVHDYEDGRDLYQEALKVLEAKKLTDRVNPNEVKKGTELRSGLLVDVTRVPESTL